MCQQKASAEQHFSRVDRVTDETVRATRPYTPVGGENPDGPVKREKACEHHREPKDLSTRCKELHGYW